MQSQLNCFVAVFVVHVVDDVQCGDVLSCQPVHEMIQTIHYIVIIQVFRFNWLSFRADLNFQFFVNTAVDCVQHGFRQVRTGTEELHLLTDHHW